MKGVRHEEPAAGNPHGGICEGGGPARGLLYSEPATVGAIILPTELQSQDAVLTLYGDGSIGPGAVKGE